MDELGLKDTDKLTFVYQTVYNTGPVRLIRKAKVDGSISASCKKMLNLLVKVSEWTGETHLCLFVLTLVLVLVLTLVLCV